MPPRKNIESTTTAPIKKPQEKKPPKPKVKPLKPKLKTPLVIKLKIPTESLNNFNNMTPKVANINKEMSPKLTRKQLTVKKKLDLANEVAAAQLGNKQHTVLETAEVVVQPKPKRVRQKKTLEATVKPTQLLEQPSDSPSVNLATDSEVAAAQLDNKQHTVLETAKVVVPPKPKRVRQKKILDATTNPTQPLEQPSDSPSVSLATDSEVAAAQLGNKQHTVLETAEVVVPPKQKRGRPKKTLEATVKPTQPLEQPSDSPSVNIATDSEDAFDVIPKKRKCVRKTLTTAAVDKPVTVKTSRGKKSLSLSPQKKIIQNKLTDAKSEITKTSKPVTRADKAPVQALTIQCRTRNQKLKAETGKTDVKETLTTETVSSSILDKVEVDNLKKENTTESEYLSEPGSIDSRKTSLTSECLSWTKDISSSSTSTCVTVCSKDVVRIDKKMPIIKLTPTTCHLNKDLNNTGASIESSSSSDSESSESEPSQNRTQKELTPEMESRSLDLSTSSISPIKTPRPASSASFASCQNDGNDEMSKITYCIDKLASKLKHFDLEIINWIGYENEEVDLNRKQFHDNIYKMLKEESEVIAQCRYLKKVLSDNVGEEDASEKSMEAAKEADTNAVSDGVDNENDRYPAQLTSDKSKESDDENNFTTDRVRYMPFDQNCDDDDALSLFAESITGIESSRRNSSAASMCTTADFEEYIPKPIRNDIWEPAKKISYVPTPCSSEKQNDVKTKPVCEKQNADSTSIYKESEQYKVSTAPFQNNVPPPLNVNTVAPKKQPCLMSYIFKPLNGVKSALFHGVCFFNILSSCKKGNNCRFPHVIPSHDEITAKLVRFSEETFIQEYMLLRNWPILRRKYGTCFVHECVRRDLTRLLVEMALDFIMKMNETYRDDIILKVDVTECVLLHLNNVDLGMCEDLLMYKHQDMLLCEIFMQVIANTQNFSRFKFVFINLTRFILKQGRTFYLDVATQVLERICILPCEPPVLEALLEIVKNTDQAILNNSMLGHFENQLSVTSKELYDELLKLKKDAAMNRPVLQNLYESSPKAVPVEIEPVNTNPLVIEREKRYTSPDTTNLDSMSKTTEEPIITRIIDFSRDQLFGCTIQRSFTNSNSSNDSSEEARPKVLPKPNFSSWRDRSIFNSIRGRSPGRLHGTPRPIIKRHVHQQLNFAPSVPKFPRRSGPDFF